MARMDKIMSDEERIDELIRVFTEAAEKVGIRVRLIDGDKPMGKADFMSADLGKELWIRKGTG